MLRRLLVVISCLSLSILIPYYIGVFASNSVVVNPPKEIVGIYILGLSLFVIGSSVISGACFIIYWIFKYIKG